MKQKKMMLLVLIGLIPFLLAFRFGGEIRYGDPTKFQVNDNGYAIFRDIAFGDVDGDGDQDLIALYNLGTVTEKRNEVRLYLNQNAELGGPGPTALGGTPSGTPKAIDTLFSSSNTSGTGNMYVIYQDGWRGTQGTDPSFGRYLMQLPAGDTSPDYRSYFTRLAVAYKTVSGKSVVDYIVVARQYGPPVVTYYTGFAYTPRHYAGRIMQLRNPYTGANPDDVKAAWLNNAGAAHPGNLNHFDPGYHLGPPVVGSPSTTDANFYRDDYTWKAAVGDDTARATFNSIELAKLDADGDYDLYAAPRQYHTADQSGDNVIFGSGRIYRYLNDGTNNFGNAYNDNNPGANSLWSDGSSGGGSYYQFFDFHLVDIDKDGIPDLLGLQGGGSGAPLSWIVGRNTGTFANTNCKNAQLNAGGTMADIWAGNLRALTSGSEGDNNNGYPDLLCSRAAEAKIEVSMYSNKSENTPSTATYSDWQAIYTAPTSEVADPANLWMWNLKFGRVMTADVDNCGENEIIVTAGTRTAQYWIFKKQTTRYLTMNLEQGR
jgi:hypothetical protein